MTKANNNKVKFSEKLEEELEEVLLLGDSLVHFHLDCSSHSASLLCRLALVTGEMSGSLFLVDVSDLSAFTLSQKYTIGRRFARCFGSKCCSAEMSVTQTRHSKQRNVKPTGIRGAGCSWISHLHLPLHQVGPELLGCADNLPLVPQQVHPEILDVTGG